MMLKEMEFKTKNPQIESIDSPGALDKFAGKTASKDFRGWISSRIGIATKQNNLDVQKFLENIKKAYNYYHPKQVVEVEATQWQGKSNIQIIKRIDGLTIIKYQRPDKFSEPKEIRTYADTEELSSVVNAILYYSHLPEIETKDIARQFSYRILRYKSDYFKKSVYRNGKFDWDSFFANRTAHNKLTLILNALDKLKFIEYLGGKTKLINKNISIQTILR